MRRKGYGFFLALSRSLIQGTVQGPNRRKENVGLRPKERGEEREKERKLREK